MAYRKTLNVRSPLQGSQYKREGNCRRKATLKPSHAIDELYMLVPRGRTMPRLAWSVANFLAGIQDTASRFDMTYHRETFVSAKETDVDRGCSG